jgi:hypothetical protein
MLPSPQPLDFYRLVLKKIRGNFKHYKLEGEPSNIGMIGIEYESKFEPFKNKRREIKDFLIGEGYTDGISNLHQLMMVCKEVLFEYTSDLLYGEPVLDGGGLEVITHPCTYKAHQALYPEYERILQVFDFLGFSDEFGGDGIHINVDKILLGDTIVEQNECLAKMLWFFYKNCDFMVEISNRTAKDSGLVDIYTLLGDSFGNLHAEHLDEIFRTEKGSLLEALGNSIEIKALNIRVNRRGRPTLEFRWFGSTNKAAILMAMIEFMMALIDYCKVSLITDLQIKRFSMFVSENKDTYPLLLQRLTEMKTTKNYFS